MCLICFYKKNTDSLKKFNYFVKTQNVKWAILEITEQCNFRCIWCYNKNRSSSNIKIDRIREIIKILYNSGVKQVTLSGGEPLMHPDIIEIVKLFSQNYFIVHILSNGYLLDNGMARKLSKAGLTQIQINIDSIDSAKHDKIRRVDYSAFEYAQRALDNAAACGISVVMQTVLTNKNKDELIDLLELANKKGINKFRIWDVTPVEGKLDKDSLNSNNSFNYLDEIEKLLPYAESLGYNKILSYEPLLPLINKTKLKGFCIEHFPCPNKLGILINIKFNGDIMLCCTLREHILYNLFDYKDISNIHSLKIKESRSKLPFDKGCNNCYYYPSCLGGCFARRIVYKNLFDYQCKNNKHKIIKCRVNRKISCN